MLVTVVCSRIIIVQNNYIKFFFLTVPYKKRTDTGYVDILDKKAGVSWQN